MSISMHWRRTRLLILRNCTFCQDTCPRGSKAAWYCHQSYSRKGLWAAIFHTIDALLTQRSAACSSGTAREACLELPERTVRSPETSLPRRRWKVVTGTPPATSAENCHHVLTRAMLLLVRGPWWIEGCVHCCTLVGWIGCQHQLSMPFLMTHA